MHLFKLTKTNHAVDFTIGQLVAAGVQLGHREERVDQRMFEVLLGNRQGIFIIDLTKTIRAMKPALAVITSLVARRRRILFANVDPRVFSLIPNRVKNFCLRYFVVNRKLPGILTNFLHLRKSILSLKLTKQFPSFVSAFSSYDHHILWESNLLNLPSFGVFDSDTNSLGHSFYAVPGNDDSFGARFLYYNLIFKALKNGFQRHVLNWGIKKSTKFKKIFNFLYKYMLSKERFFNSNFFQLVSILNFPRNSANSILPFLFSNFRFPLKFKILLNFYFKILKKILIKKIFAVNISNFVFNNSKLKKPMSVGFFSNTNIGSLLELKRFNPIATFNLFNFFKPTGSKIFHFRFLKFVTANFYFKNYYSSSLKFLKLKNKLYRLKNLKKLVGKQQTRIEKIVIPDGHNNYSSNSLELRDNLSQVSSSLTAKIYFHKNKYILNTEKFFYLLGQQGKKIRIKKPLTISMIGFLPHTNTFNGFSIRLNSLNKIDQLDKKNLRRFSVFKPIYISKQVFDVNEDTDVNEDFYFQLANWTKFSVLDQKLAFIKSCQRIINIKGEDIYFPKFVYRTVISEILKDKNFLKFFKCCQDYNPNYYYLAKKRKAYLAAYIKYLQFKIKNEPKFTDKPNKALLPVVYNNNPKNLKNVQKDPRVSGKDLLNILNNFKKRFLKLRHLYKLRLIYRRKRSSLKKFRQKRRTLAVMSKNLILLSNYSLTLPYEDLNRYSLIRMNYLKNFFSYWNSVINPRQFNLLLLSSSANNIKKLVSPSRIFLLKKKIRFYSKANQINFDFFARKNKLFQLQSNFKEIVFNLNSENFKIFKKHSLFKTSIAKPLKFINKLFIKLYLLRQKIKFNKIDLAKAIQFESNRKVRDFKYFQKMVKFKPFLFRNITEIYLPKFINFKDKINRSHFIEFMKLLGLFKLDKKKFQITDFRNALSSIKFNYKNIKLNTFNLLQFYAFGVPLPKRLSQIKFIEVKKVVLPPEKTT